MTATGNSTHYVCPKCKTKTHAMRCPNDQFYTTTMRAIDKADGDPLLGKEIGGRFGLIERLGMGGMGAVYKGVDLDRGLTVAVKVLREAYAKHPAIRERFIREAEAGASLNHPNVVPLIDFGVEKSGRLWLAMEYVKGWTLRDEINHNGAFSVASAIELMKQLLRGLEVAHEAGMIHRDLKHDNVMYFGKRSNFTARIVDFGVVKSEAADLLAGSVDQMEVGDLNLEATIREASKSMGGGGGELGQKELTAVGMMVGSPSYMAPEQIRGLKVGPPADLYSIAVIIYEVLTARRLFSVNDYETLLKEGAKRDASPLVFTAKSELIPEAFSKLIDRVLSHDPTDRYPDAHTMLLALDQLELRESRIPAELLSRIPSYLINQNENDTEQLTPQDKEVNDIVDRSSSDNTQAESQRSSIPVNLTSTARPSHMKQGLWIQWALPVMLLILGFLIALLSRGT